MKKNNKAISLCLCAIILATSLLSCSKDGASKNTGDSESVTAVTEVTTVEETTIDDAALNDPKLEAVNYDGCKFQILINGNELEPNIDFDAEELNGETLNDAIFTRDANLEEKYNIAFSVEHKDDSEIQKDISKSNSAGDASYSMIEVDLNYSLTMAANGLLTSIDSIPNIDLEKPYWNAITLEGSSIKGKNYFAYSDTNLHAFGATPCVIFNKQVLENNNLGDIYSVVTSGAWTMDEMAGMISKVTSDLNGDGVMDKDDKWGLITNNFGVDCLISGTGYKMILKDENDIPTLNVPSEKFYAVLDKVAKVLSLETGSMLVDRTSETNEAREYWTEHAMTENRALFWIGNLKCVERLRNMETDFGIVPMPKLDDTQENYSVHRQAGIGATISVPFVVSDVDMVGRVIEDMSYMSYRDVLPVYMNTVLEGKFFRDPQSSVTLEIMRDGIYCDLGFMSSNFGISILTTCREIITKNKDSASMFAKVTDKYNKSLEKLITSFDNLA